MNSAWRAVLWQFFRAIRLMIALPFLVALAVILSPNEFEGLCQRILTYLRARRQDREIEKTGRLH